MVLTEAAAGGGAQPAPRVLERLAARGRIARMPVGSFEPARQRPGQFVKSLALHGGGRA